MNGVKQELGLKSDPDTKSPGGFIDDDDIYEDTGELNMPPKGVDNELWLTRIPKWLWEALESTGEGDDVEVGRIAVVTDPKTGKPSKDHPMRIFFNDNWYHTTKVPRAYDLTPAPQADQPANTYVFTEKDLPGYKPMLYGRGRIDVPQAVQDPKARVQKRGKYRKAIPKHTSLIGSTTREYNSRPVNTPEFHEFNAARNQRAFEGANKSTILIDAKSTEHADKQRADKAFENFITKPRTGKQKDNKAARMPRNELTDLLHTMFDQYSFWPMRSIKAHTQQPEAYLKEVLSGFADLIKSGSFASCWMRQPAYDRNTINQIHGKPPEMEGDDGGIDDEDDNIEMEDVV